MECLHILDQINFGYLEIEPVILGLMALHKSFVLVGRHGTGKTRLARILSQGYRQHSFVFYDATKEDLISIAGIPDPDSLKGGQLQFVPHQRAIWDKATIVVDEVTRANKENQNLWLEIIEEHTCFGLPLAYKSLIATANPDSYAAAFTLDEALLDRFYAVIPVPELQTRLQDQDVQQLIALASEPTLDGRRIGEVFSRIRQAHQDLLAEGAMEKISTYLGKFIPLLFDSLTGDPDLYISPRTYARNLPETMLAVAAYFRVVGTAYPLVDGALQALRYALATKLQLPLSTVEQLHESLKVLLYEGALPEADQLRFTLNSLHLLEEKLTCLQTRWADMRRLFSPDELEQYLPALVAEIEQQDCKASLLDLKRFLSQVEYTGDSLRKLEGKVIILLNATLNKSVPRLRALVQHEHVPEQALEKMTRLQRLIEEHQFIQDESPNIMRIKQFLLEVYEGKRPDDDMTFIQFFVDEPL